MFRPESMVANNHPTGLWHGAGFVDEKACSWLLQDITALTGSSPLRRMKTPYGSVMQVEMSNCGDYGWISDAEGYRYGEMDPLTGAPWPDMPARWKHLANNIASQAGFDGFLPDVALINCYTAGKRLGLHQDKDEENFQHPVVSVSMGYSANFIMGGRKRNDRTRHIRLGHGDALVFGGHMRLAHHGIADVRDDGHPMGCRWNITFRKARG